MKFMRLLGLFGLILFYSTAIGQNFYDITSIQNISINFGYTNWDYRLDTAKAGSEGYIIARSCTINGVAFDSVGVKYKGNSSYRATNVKNPLHIELNYVRPWQNYQGINDIKLGNGFFDPSVIREALSYELLGNYMRTPRCNFARVHLNGVFMGLYSNAEHIGDPMLAKNFSSTHGTLVKCNPTNVSSNSGPDLRYLGANSSSYTPYYEIKRGTGFPELIALCDTLNNRFANIERILDMDASIWMLAFNNLFVNLDSYSGSFRQNYYLYRSESNRFTPIVWDLNMSFAGFTQANNTPSGRVDTNTAKTFPFNSNSTSTLHPLISKMFTNATYRRMFQAHIRTMAEEQFASGNVGIRGAAIQAIVDSSVQADPNKFYTYTNFRNNLNSSIPGGGGGPGGGGTSGITTLVAGRLAYLNTQSWYTSPKPNITVSASNSAPAFLSQVIITANIPNISTNNSVFLGYRDHKVKSFSKLTMYDDGQHNDGAAGDKVFGATISVSSAKMEYYVYAEDLTSDIGAFSPARAEYEFYSLNATLPSIANGDVTLNEFVSWNTTGITDYDGQLEDWIELKNNTGSPISMEGLFLTDTLGNRQKWSFPKQTVIPANGRLLVWCDEDGEQGGLHANFKLDAAGERILLVNGNATMDSTLFGQMFANLSSARCADGTGPFLSARTPTPMALNSCPSSNQDLSFQLSMFPNPGHESFSLVSDQPIQQVNIYNVTGQMVQKLIAGNVQRMDVSMDGFPNGLYFVEVNGKSYKWLKN